MSSNNNHNLLKPKPWERQPAESEKAFEGLRCYLELGMERSIRRVAAKVDKGRTLVGRWSKNYNWVDRARQYDNFLLGEVDDNARKLAKERWLEIIMTWREVLARTSFLARASLDNALDENGRFDIRRARETGVVHALKKINYYPNGMVKSLELRDRNASLHDLGTHHGLWTDEIKDPDEVLSQLLGIPKALLPAHLDEPDAIDTYVDEVSNNGEDCSTTLAQDLPTPPTQAGLDTNGGAKHTVEEGAESDGEKSATVLSDEPTAPEFPVANPPTPSRLELDEKAPRENALKGCRKLSRGNVKLPVE